MKKNGFINCKKNLIQFGTDHRWEKKAENGKLICNINLKINLTFTSMRQE